MAQYVNFNSNKRNKRKRIITAGVVMAVVIVLAVYIIGIFTGNSDERERVSSAVSENVRLKEQVSEMSERIAFLEQENEELHAQLALAPTPAPTAEVPEASIQPTASPVQNTSPRGDR